MSAPQITDDGKYPSYSGLDRVANIQGVPLIPGVTVFCGCLLIGVVGGKVLGPAGLLLALTGLPILMYFRWLCETDDQALHIAWFEIACAFDRRNAALYGGTYTLAPVRYGEWKPTDYRDFFERGKRRCYHGDSPISERGGEEP